MTPLEVYSAFRSDVFDAVEPFLWSDSEIAAYAALAQEGFVRRTGGIQDATSTLTQLAVVTSGKWIAYSPLILRIVTAKLRSTGDEVLVLNPPDLVASGNPWGPRTIDLPGGVCALVAGLDDANLRVVQVPQANDTIDLVIERLPLLTPDAAGAFEIQAQHHYYLLYWMKHLAYLKQDAETYDEKKAMENAANFEAYCAKAFEEKERRKNKPRLIQYGGLPTFHGLTRYPRW